MTGDGSATREKGASPGTQDATSRTQVISPGGCGGGGGVCAHHGGLQSMGSLASQPMVLPGKNTGVGSHSLLQGIFPTQGSDPGLLHCRWILSHLSHRGILEDTSFKGLTTTQVERPPIRCS